jgi:hypothetical protein
MLRGDKSRAANVAGTMKLSKNMIHINLKGAKYTLRYQGCPESDSIAALRR